MARHADRSYRAGQDALPSREDVHSEREYGSAPPDASATPARVCGGHNRLSDALRSAWTMDESHAPTRQGRRRARPRVVRFRDLLITLRFGIGWVEHRVVRSIRRAGVRGLRTGTGAALGLWLDCSRTLMSLVAY
jgi:hypothetical protein